MKFVIVDVLTGQKVHESLIREKALTTFARLKKQSMSVHLFIAKSNGHLLAKVA